MTAARKFYINVQLTEEEARHLAVMQKELGIKPADSIRKALTMFFSRPIQDVGKTRRSR